MATRPTGTKFKAVNATQVVHTGIGNLYSLSMNWRGATAGNRVTVHDGLDATGAVMEEIIVNDANSVNPMVIPLPAVGKQFATGLFVNLGAIAGEVNVSVGYDGNA